MFEDMGSQQILITVGLVLLGGMALTGLYFLLKAAWRRLRVATMVVLVGLLPGFLIGYLMGKDMLHLPDMPSFTADTPSDPEVATQPTVPEPTSKVVMHIAPSEEFLEPEPADQAVSLSEEDILPDDPGSIAAANGITEPIADQPAESQDDQTPGDEPSAPDTDMPDEADTSNTPETETDVAFLPRRNPNDIATPEPPQDKEQTSPPAPATEDTQTAPELLTEAEITRNERLADAADYMQTGALIIDDQPAGAVTFYKKALEVYKEYGTDEQVGNAYHDLGVASLKAGEFDDALTYTITALKAGQEINDRLMVIHALTNLGFIYMNKRDPANALIYYNQALDEARDAPNTLSLAMLQENIGYAYGAQGNYEKALEHLNASLDIAQTLEMNDGVAALIARVGTNIKDYQ